MRSSLPTITTTISRSTRSWPSQRLARVTSGGAPRLAMWPLRSRHRTGLRLNDDDDVEDDAEAIVLREMRTQQGGLGRRQQQQQQSRRRRALPSAVFHSIFSAKSRLAGLTLWASLAFTMFTLYALRHDRITLDDRLLGWQAFERITTSTASSPSSSAQANAWEAASSGAGNGSTAVTFPLDLYLPLLPNDVGLTDLAVRKCVALLPCFPPTTPDLDAQLGRWVRVERYLDSSAALGTSSLSWLSMFFAFEETYLFYRRSRLAGAPRIVDVRLLEEGKDLPSHLPDDGAGGWKIIDVNVRAKFLKWKGLPSAKVVYRCTEPGTPASKLKMEPITEIEVVYGPNPPWPGFEEAGTILPDNMKDGTESVTLTIRRTPAPVPPLPQPVRFKSDGTFKIMQIADLHFSVGHEVCRDTDKDPCVGDVDTLSLLAGWLDEERPDLVVLSGDQLNGQSTSWDVKSVLPKVTKMLSDRKIMFAAIQGNHDSETDKLTRRQQQVLLSLLPYSLTRVGPESIHGASNYDIKLHSPTPDNSHIFTLYFLDSGDYPAEAQKSSSLLGSVLGSGAGGAGGGKGKKKPTMKGKLSHYDWVRRDQIEWLLELSGRVKKMVRPYVPDGAADLAKQPWKMRRRRRSELVDERQEHGREDSDRARRRTSAPPSSDSPDKAQRRHDEDASPYPDAQETQERQGKALAKPPAMLFVHIPVPEAYDAKLVDVDVEPGSGKQGDRKKMVISSESGAGGALVGTEGLLEADQRGGQGDRGLFDALLEQGDAERDVKVLSFGHNHLNEACRRAKGIWLCFNGGSSYAGYGKSTFPRRVRIYDLSHFGNKISTYARLDGGEYAGKRVGEGVLYEER